MQLPFLVPLPSRAGTPPSVPTPVISLNRPAPGAPAAVPTSAAPIVFPRPRRGSQPSAPQPTTEERIGAGRGSGAAMVDRALSRSEIDDLLRTERGSVRRNVLGGDGHRLQNEGLNPGQTPEERAQFLLDRELGSSGSGSGSGYGSSGGGYSGGGYSGGGYSSGDYSGGGSGSYDSVPDAPVQPIANEPSTGPMSPDQYLNEFYDPEGRGFRGLEAMTDRDFQRHRQLLDVMHGQGMELAGMNRQSEQAMNILNNLMAETDSHRAFLANVTPRFAY